MSISKVFIRRLSFTNNCCLDLTIKATTRFCSCDSRLSQPSERSDEDSNLVYEKTDSGSKSAGMASDLKEFFPLNSHLNGVQFAPKKSILNDSSKNFTRSYKETIETLLKFQSNASVIKSSLNIPHEELRQKADVVIEYLKSLQISIDDLDRLNIIHVAGTKGKGSTCSYIESILRYKGYKTGLFTSPHLLTVRERIKINGVNLSEEAFINYFWTINDKLQDTSSPPNFFRFMTVMAFYIFVKENVDVLILETGIGGEFDSTNVIQKPIVVGITSLGMDHVDILGNSIKSIAWHKAGIFKQNSIAVTAPQIPVAMEVIEQRSKEKCCPVHVSRSIDLIKSVKLGIEGDVQKVNAALALDLCRIWESKVLHKSQVNGSELTEEEKIALQRTEWPGRCQMVCRGNKTFFLDGAQTVESIENCINWFKCKTCGEDDSTGGQSLRILIFSSTGSRSYEPLLKRIIKEKFDFAIFVPPVTDPSGHYDEMRDWRYDDTILMDRIKKMNDFWINNCAVNRRKPSSLYFKSILEALYFLNSPKNPEMQFPTDAKMHILVTGSLLLVGRVLTIFKLDMIE